MQCGPQPVGRAGAAYSGRTADQGGWPRLEAAPLDPDLKDLPGSPDDHRHDSDDQSPVCLPILTRLLMPASSAEGHFAPLYSHGHLFPLRRSPCGEVTGPFGRLRTAAERASSTSRTLTVIDRSRREVARRVAGMPDRAPAPTTANVLQSSLTFANVRQLTPS